MKKKHVAVCILMAISFLILWIIWGNVTVGVTRYTVASTSLPRNFDGYRIAVVSDLHNAQFGKGNVQLIEKIEKAQPNIIAITGDFLFPKYDAGLFTEDNMTMIVSRGIGNSIIPVRFNNRPEIVVVELKCE